jgi:hypothetical protein
MGEGGTGARLRVPDRRWLARLSTIIVVVPCLLAVVRAWADGWTAAGDNAFIAIRSLDVLDGHHPLLGSSSSLSVGAGPNVHHPGPLVFDLLAGPCRVLGVDIAIPVAIGALNALCAWWTVHLVGRVAGLGARVLAALVVGLLLWTMTPALVVDPWNPHASLLPMLLFFVACGALAVGEHRALIAIVVAGSLSAQNHIGNLYVVGATLVVTIGLRWWHRRSSPDEPVGWSRSELVLPITVFIVLWAQPVADLIIDRGDSNVAAIIESLRSGQPDLGPRLGTRIGAAVLAVPPWWLPGGFAEPNPVDPPLALAMAAVTLVLLVLLLARIGFRAPTSPLRTFGLLAAALVPCAVLAVSRVPLHPLGYSPHQWRWLWSLAVLVTFVLGWALLEVARRHGRIPSGQAAIVACLVVVGLNLVGTSRPLPTVEQEREAVTELVEGLPYDDLARCGAVVVHYEPGFAAPALVGPSVLLALRERNLSFSPTADDAVEQLDRPTADDADCRLTLSDREVDGRIVGRLDEPLALVVTFATSS